MELKSLYIKNYKNFKELKIETLAPVNLIIGRNNVGKSNLLEALWLYTANGSTKRLSEILQRRGKDTTIPSIHRLFEERESLLLEFVYHRDKRVFYNGGTIQIGETDNGSAALSMGLVKYIFREEEKNGIKTVVDIKKISLNDSLPQPPYQAKTAWGIFTQQKKHIMVPLDYGDLWNASLAQVAEIPCQYVYSSAPNVSLRNASLWDNIVLSPKANYVIEALRIIDARIDQLAFKASSQPGDRQPYITYKGSEGSYRLSALGDGMNRVLSILLAMVNCENGLCLIDELENGLHYSVQVKLWQMIFMLAEKYHIQVFVTTHSRDCIHSFIAVNKPQLGKIIRLDNRNGDIVAENYDDTEDMRFIAEKGIEIR